MQLMTRLAAIAVATGLLAGCSGSDDARDETRASDGKTDTPIADSLKQPMDKARAVEDTVMQRKADMDKRLADAEGDADDEP